MTGDCRDRWHCIHFGRNSGLWLSYKRNATVRTDCAHIPAPLRVVHVGASFPGTYLSLYEQNCWFITCHTISSDDMLAGAAGSYPRLRASDSPRKWDSNLSRRLLFVFSFFLSFFFVVFLHFSSWKVSSIFGNYLFAGHVGSNSWQSSISTSFLPSSLSLSLFYSFPYSLHSYTLLFPSTKSLR